MWSLQRPLGHVSDPRYMGLVEFSSHEVSCETLASYVAIPGCNLFVHAWWRLVSLHLYETGVATPGDEWCCHSFW